VTKGRTGRKGSADGRYGQKGQTRHRGQIS
jgi:hypothetical protein